VEQTQITQAAIALASMDTIADHSSTQSAVDEALAPIIENPFSENAGHAIASLWKVIPAMCNVEAASVLDITIQRQNIMLTNSTTWKWLEVVCRENCLSHMVNRCDPDTWIKRLTDRVDNLIDSRSPTSSIIPGDFLPGFQGAPYEWKRSRLTQHLIGGPRHALIYATVTTIVRQWLGYPSTGLTQARAVFVDDIVKAMGPNILLLGIVWTSYCRLQSHVIGQSTYGSITVSNFTEFREHLTQHPLCNSESVESNALTDIGRLMHAFRNAELAKFLFPDRTLELPDDSDTPLCSSLSNTRLPSTNVAGQCHTRMGNPKLLLDFLLQLFPFIDDTLPSTPLMKKIQHNLDHYLPFRDNAPQRIKSMGPEGPYHPSVIGTRIGVFGSIFWRGVSYATNSVTDKTMLFDLTSFHLQKETLIKSIGEKATERYFCNPKAYGPYNCFRTTSSAEQYWESSGRPELISWLKKDIKPSYLEQWRFFKGTYLKDLNGKFERDSKDKKVKAFPQIGNLIRHVLTADYACAGKVQIPSIEDMGEVIAEIDAGGLKGLRALGYLDGISKPSKEQVTAALRDVYEYLSANLTERQKRLMNFGMLLIEHALCKFSRCRTYNWV
jgi:hypothetical protein